MLVLTRKIGEQICIDGQIVITVVQVKGKRIRLGITAPDHVVIDRVEVVAESDGEPESTTATNGFASVAPVLANPLAHADSLDEDGRVPNPPSFTSTRPQPRRRERQSERQHISPALNRSTNENGVAVNSPPTNQGAPDRSSADSSRRRQQRAE